ncbi:hypothetical protein FRC02_004240, partial [Tulasnella sp. 418]
MVLQFSYVFVLFLVEEALGTEVLAVCFPKHPLANESTKRPLHPPLSHFSIPARTYLALFPSAAPIWDILVTRHSTPSSSTLPGPSPPAGSPPTHLKSFRAFCSETSQDISRQLLEDPPPPPPPPS